MQETSLISYQMHIEPHLCAHTLTHTHTPIHTPLFFNLVMQTHLSFLFQDTHNFHFSSCSVLVPSLNLTQELILLGSIGKCSLIYSPQDKLGLSYSLYCVCRSIRVLFPYNIIANFSLVFSLEGELLSRQEVVLTSEILCTQCLAYKRGSNVY